MAYGRSIDVPSFWDYLSEGLQNFTRAGVQSSERRHAQEAFEFQKQQADLENTWKTFQTRLGLVQSGLADPTSLESAPKPKGLEGISLTGETPQMTRRRILKMPKQSTEIPGLVFGMKPTPIKGQETVSDDEKRYAGIQTTGEAAAERLQSFVTSYRLKRLGEGGPEVQAAIAGVPSDTDIKLQQITKWTPVLDNAATNFVGAALNASGGRLDRRRLATYATHAYDEFKKSNSLDKSGLRIPDEMDETARSYFEHAVRQEYLKQQEMDLQRAIAAMRNGEEPHERFRVLDQAVQTQLNIFKTSTEGPMGMLAQMDMGKDPATLSPARLKAVQNFQKNKQLLDVMVQQRNALGQMLGIAPLDMNSLLSDQTGAEGDTPTAGQPPAPPNAGSGTIKTIQDLDRAYNEALAKNPTPRQREMIDAEYKRLKAQFKGSQ